MPMPSDDVAGDVWFRLLAAAGKARHPELALWRFVADTGVLPCGARLLDHAWEGWWAGIIAEWSFRSSTCLFAACWAA